MAYFGGLTTFVQKQYHTYNPDSISLKNIGLASYTRNSLQRFGYNYNSFGQLVLDETVREYFQGGVPRPSLLGDASNYSIEHYDTENDEYVTRSGASVFETPSGNAATSLAGFQQFWDRYQRGEITEPLLKWRIYTAWANINNSLNGCITFDTAFNILGCLEQTKINVFFTSAGKTSDDRKVALKGSPTIVTIPKDAAFEAYSYYNTMNAPPGQSVGVSEGDLNNSDNTVAAQALERYDPVTGKIEYGTFQLMARLLDDLDGIILPELPPNVDIVDYSSFKMRNPPVGSGVPLIAHNGNPRDIGANSYECSTGKKQTIQVVNYTPRSYKRGDLILCSFVNGSWVPMGYDLPKVTPKKLEIEWSEMQKYIVNAHSFFRDFTNLYNVTSEDYIARFRYVYYAAETGYIHALNYYKITSKDQLTYTNGKWEIPKGSASNAANLIATKRPLGPGYLAVCDADQIDSSLGGNNTYGSFYLKTNLAAMPVDSPEDNVVFALSAPLNWGMFFPDGYSSVGVTKTKKNLSSGFSIIGSAGGAGIYGGSGGDATTTTTQAPGEGEEGGDGGGTGGPNFSNVGFDLSDSNFYHFPAQMAIHSKEKPTINYFNLWNAMYSTNTNATYQTILNNLRNYTTALVSGGNSTYGLKPISPKKIHFYSLPMELALSDTNIDYSGGTPKSYNQDGYSNLKNQLEVGWNAILSILKNIKLDEDARAGSSLGNMWNRNGLKEPIECRKKDPIITSSVGFSDDVLVDHRTNTVKVDVVNRPPVGGPNIFPHINYEKERSNVVGILGAKATVNLPNGGAISFNTENRFGARSYAMSTITGGSIVSTVIGQIAAWSQDLTGKSRDISIKQWGATDEGNPNSFGTTALFCKVYDHCPNTLYDARYFAPLQFNPASGVSFSEPVASLGAKVGKGSTIKTVENNIRAGKLLSDGGFSYFKKVIGIVPGDIVIQDVGEGYQNEKVILTFGGSSKFPATAEVAIANGELSNNIKIIEPGEFSSSAFNSPITGSITGKDGEQLVFTKSARVQLRSGTVVEKFMHDPEPRLIETVMLTPSSNRGAGDDKGIVKSNVNKSVNVAANSTGKYDLFFFFVNDIIHTPMTWQAINAYDTDFPSVQYVKLDISTG